MRGSILARRALIPALPALAFTSAATAAPLVHDPSRFTVELFAASPRGADNMSLFTLFSTNGSGGFTPGVYATGGLFSNNALVKIEADGSIVTVATGFAGGNEAAMAARALSETEFSSPSP